MAKTTAFVFLLLWPSTVIGQDIDLGEARRAVLDLSSHQLSVLESVVGKVPPEAQGGISEAIRAQESGRNRALDALSSARGGHISKEVGVARAYEAVDQGTRTHLEVLSGLVDKVPEPAKPAIEHALRESQTGRNTALSTLSAIKQGHPVPAGAGRIDRHSFPEKPGKPEGVGVFGSSKTKGGPPFGQRPGGFEKPSGPSFPRGLPGGGRPGGFPGIPGIGKPGR